MPAPETPWKNFALLSLLFSNLLTIVFAVILNWNIFVVLWIYWFQSISIGFVHVLRIITLPVDKNAPPKKFKKNVITLSPLASKIYLSIFFIIHYGLFHFVYAGFLLLLPISGTAFLVAGGGTIDAGNILIDILFVLLSGGIFFVNHLVSFFYYRKKPVKGHKFSFFYPYARIIPMHLTIIFGGFLLILPLGDLGIKIVLIFFLLLKTVADIVMHYFEHKNQIN